LLPEAALGQSYAVATRANVPIPPIFPDLPDQRGFFAVVAIADGTEVTFTPAAAVAAGPGLLATALGEARTVVLERGEVLTVFGTNPSDFKGADLTGSLVVADKPVAVFAGHEEASVGAGSGVTTCCADMLQTQLFPGESQGTDVLALRSPPRASEPDVWVIQAVTGPTTVTLVPDPTGQSGAALTGAGATLELVSFESFHVSATGPVQVFQLLAGGEAANDLGDPALTEMVPTDRLLTRYDVWMVAGYQRRVSLGRMAGTTVTIDGEVVGAELFEAVGDTGWEAGSVTLSAGVHTLTGSAPFAAQVYGYADKGAFAAPAGLGPPTP
jgi:hypothetical protein